MSSPRALPPAIRSLPALTIVVVLVGASLRAPIVAVAPVAREIGSDLAVGAAVVGLLTSIPVLCFAVFAPLAIGIVRRGGADFALTVALGGALVGCIVRSTGGVAVALVGTAVMGAFIAIGNVVIPIVIAREYSAHRAHTMTGVYTSALNVGTMTVTVATAPLSSAIGWRWAILSWAVFGLAALVVWIPLRGLRAALAPSPGPRSRAAEGSTAVLRHGPTWLLAAAFAGQAFAFYAMTAWLPTLLADQGFSGAAAGAISAIFQVAGIAGSLLLPVVTLRASLRVAAIAAGVAWLTVPLGFLFAPGLWLVWCAVGGLAQGAGITIVFIMINGFGDDAHTTAGRSGFVQGFGYAVAAAGPLLLGALHEATHAWVLPLVVVLVAVVLFAVAGIAVAAHIQRLQQRGRDYASSGQPV